MSFIKTISRLYHIHRWETTHTNRWLCPTRQECRCGISREFRYREDTNGPPWYKGEWAWSNGRTSKYGVND